ncbi:unnamed protein product [Penicillium salamii]|nr:unnamed protein product [Penicillium salamii]
MVIAPMVLSPSLNIPTRNNRLNWIFNRNLPLSLAKAFLSKTISISDCHPANLAFTMSDQNKIGGVHTASHGEIIEKMSILIAQRRIKDMAIMFNATCLGDWTHGREGAWGDIPFRFYKFNELLEGEAEIYSTIPPFTRPGPAFYAPFQVFGGSAAGGQQP